MAIGIINGKVLMDKTIAGDKLEDVSISTRKIVDKAVTAAKLDNGAVSAKIKAGENIAVSTDTNGVVTIKSTGGGTITTPEKFLDNSGYESGVFELKADANISFYREVDTSFTISDKSPSINSATICNVVYKNISTDSIFITLPNTGNYLVPYEMNVVEVRAGNVAQISMQGLGTKRFFTYIN